MCIRDRSEPFTPEGWWCLDATLFFHEGKPYSVFCHEWLQVKNGEMWITELSSDLKKAVGEPKLIFKAADAPWSKSWGDGNCITDGPFVHKKMCIRDRSKNVQDLIPRLQCRRAEENP